MTEAELDSIAEALRMAGPLPYYRCEQLIKEVRRLRAVLVEISKDIEYSPIAAAVAHLALCLLHPPPTRSDPS